MNSVTKFNIKNPKDFEEKPLEEIIRNGAQKMLRLAIELEVQEYCENYKNLLDEKGHRTVIRNEYLPERKIQVGIGPISIQQPRVRNGEEQFKRKYSLKTKKKWDML